MMEKYNLSMRYNHRFISKFVLFYWQLTRKTLCQRDMSVFISGWYWFITSATFKMILIQNVTFHYRPTHKWTRKWSEFISTKKAIFWLKSRGFWCCERFDLKELGPLKSCRWLVDYFGPSSYRQFFQWKNEGASESIIE